ARAAAACTYCHIVFEAERRFMGRPRIVPLDLRGLKVWLIDDKAVIRWKKMDEDGRSRSYPTKQAQDFDRGATFLELPAPATRLAIGYYLNPTQTEIIRIQIAKPLGKAIDWCAAIVPDGGTGSAGKRWVEVTRRWV